MRAPQLETFNAKLQLSRFKVDAPLQPWPILLGLVGNGGKDHDAMGFGIEGKRFLVWVEGLGCRAQDSGLWA